jgi:class 3 adenylate cyclase
VTRRHHSSIGLRQLERRARISSPQRLLLGSIGPSGDRSYPHFGKTVAFFDNDAASTRKGAGTTAIGEADQKGRPIAPSRRRIKSSRNLATERKYVSILRADLHRSSHLLMGLALEDAIARLAPALEAMRMAVHQYRGIVYREMGDGIFAIFGAPVADELHAVMACFAALELLRRIEALEDDGVRVRIGVHSGLVVAGPRQVDYARTYDFDGPPLIVAERLQAIAEPGQALASEDCRVLAHRYIQFGSRQTHVLTGFTRPMIVHPIKSVEESSKWRVALGRRTSAFVGREAELSRLLAFGEAAGAGTSHNTIVSGEPGVG